MSTKKILIAGDNLSVQIMKRSLEKDLEAEIILMDKLEKKSMVENYMNIAMTVPLPDFNMYSEKKKKKPCTYHEYTERKNKVWLCRHCEQPLKS